MKSKWNIFIWIFAVLVVVNVIRGFTGEMVVTESVRQGSMERGFSAKGIIVKYETMYSSDITGTVDAYIGEGERVSKGERIAAVYNGEVNADVKNRLDRVNKRLEIIKENRLGKSVFINDASKLESEINDSIGELISAGGSGDLSGVSAIKHKIAVLADRKAVVSGEKDSAVDTQEQLSAEKANLENQINAVRNNIYAQSSGVFSMYPDNFEEEITPYNMQDFSPSALDGLYSRAKDGKGGESAYLCKVIDNFRYFVAVSASTAEVGDMKAGDEIILRFPDFSGNSLTAEVQSVSPEEDGRKSVIFETSRFVDTLILKRTANVEVIKNRYSGFKISIKALNGSGGVSGVYVVRDGVMRFVPVEVVYSTADTAVARSASAEKPLRLYDELVIKAESCEEGKAVRNR